MLMAKKAVKAAAKAPKRKSVCLVCRRERDGLPVADDPVIELIRRIKGRFGWLQGNRLVVCEEDVNAALGKRGRFEKYLMWCAILGFAFLMITTFSTSTLVLGLLVGLVGGLLIMLLPFGVYYPKIEEKALSGWMARKAKEKR